MNEMAIAWFPLLIFILYIAAFAFVIWFMVTLIKLQKEKNEHLAKIASLVSSKLDDR
ncbi:hypothetical protein [Jeotgalibacillus campisalis]|uniref:CcmD family protein n=1 Tax=Jeotgalibacillus campisalis TaxID=220754 RepID=A0A0C2SA34_9BACL|nr:hypothetical protein [Jeotgalibacillus campisalis]KIL50834.1 hypothetical protein KR50_07150 [Jeotgalibacillus campisalis]